jgi:hypothetical protein
MMVDAWTTVMSSDNECGHYCRQPDGHYYTIAVTNRQDLLHKEDNPIENNKKSFPLKSKLFVVI